MTYAEGTPESMRIRRCRLVVVSGPDKDKTAELGASRIRVGAQEGCDLVLTDRLASRYHFEICLDANGYCLRDLGSTNGTYLSGHRIREAYLNPGSVIYVGESRLRFEPQETSVSVALSPSTQFGDLLGASPEHAGPVCTS